LTKVFYVSGANFLTRDQAVIYQTLGYLSATIMQQIDDCLKKVLDLP
jgi:hypothetical protein